MTIRVRMCSGNVLPLAPDGLPLLSGGRHTDPADGACFMEFASVLAGEPFTDHPRCTHQLLGELARRVNDNVDEGTRQRLLPLVPTVVGLRNAGPTVTAAIVADVALEALAIQPESRQLRRACRRASRRGRATGPSCWWTRITDPAYRHGAGMRTVIRAVEVVYTAGPDALHGLLSAAIIAAREAQPAHVTSSRHNDDRPTGSGPRVRSTR
jgi:hypothetical protein